MQDGSTIDGYDAWFQYDSGADHNYADVNGTVKNIIEAMGSDVLYGEDGADNFVFAAIDQANAVEIGGFNAAEGDSIDLSNLLEGQDDVTQAITDFVYAREEGGSTIVSVDVDGAGGPAQAVDIARLDNTSHSSQLFKERVFYH